METLEEKLQDCHMKSRISRTSKPHLSEYLDKIEDLPLGASVLDHVDVLLSDQSEIEAGGAYIYHVKESLEQCKTKATNMDPEPVKCLSFGISTKLEVKEFLSSFGSAVREQSKSRPGFIPTNCFSFYVQELDLPLSHVYHKCSGLYTKIESAPSKVILGLGNKIWEISFPWIWSSDNYILSLEKSYPDYWLDLFSKLQGFAVGFELEKSYRSLSKLINEYTFNNRVSYISLKRFDINVMLILAGYNSHCLDLDSVVFYLTGQTWNSDLPAKINYAHLTIITATVLQIVFLINLFPSPGIGCLVTRKESLSFLQWFLGFYTSIISNCTLPKSTLAELFPRSENRDVFEFMIVKPTAYFSSEDISRMLPKWNNITSGGCPTDLIAFNHLLNVLAPIVCRPGIPTHLRWPSGHLCQLTGLFGQASGQSPSEELVGIRYDENLLKLPFIPHLTSNRRQPIISVCREFRSSLTKDSGLYNLTCEQLLILFTWLNPLFVSACYLIGHCEREEDVEGQFSNADLLYLFPLISAFLYPSLASNFPADYNFLHPGTLMPTKFTQYLQKRKRDLDESCLEHLLKRAKVCKSAENSQKISAKIGKICKRHKTENPMHMFDLSDISDTPLSDDEQEASKPAAKFDRGSLNQLDDDLILFTPDLDAEQIMRCPEF